MRSLSDSEAKAFLLEGTRTAKLSVVRKDGSPFVTPVCFLLDDDGSVVFETERRSLKGHALARDPRVSLCVEDDRPPFGFVRLDGVAERYDARKPCPVVVDYKGWQCGPGVAVPIACFVLPFRRFWGRSRWCCLAAVARRRGRRLRSS